MPFAFGEFELDERLYQIRRGDEVLKVRRGAFEVLAYLLDHRDRVVPKDELIEKIWGQRYVSESSLAHCITALRSALGDAPAAKRVIQTVYGRGYRFVAPVRCLADARPAEMPGAEGLPAGETPRRVREVFVGRDLELAQLGAALDAAREGRGRLVLITGEAGIGKTRLAEHLAEGARTRGVRVLEGRCYDADGTPPFWPWVQILRACLAGEDRREARAKLGAEAADLAELAPELLNGGCAEPVAALSVARERFLLFDAVTRFLAARSARHPLLLLIDDLHLADESSVSLLSFLVREARGGRIAIAATSEDPGRACHHPVTRAIGALTHETPVEVLRLAPLTEGEVSEFLRAVTGGPASPRLARRIHRKSDGNPLFVAEMVRLIFTEPGPEPARELAERALDIPPELRATLAQRLERLSPQCRSLLRVASVIGRQFPAELLGRIASSSPARCLALLQEASDASTLVKAPSERGLETQGLYRFTHALIRDALYEDLPVAERVGLHRAVGEALEQQPAGGAGELAHHFFQSLDAESLAKAARYSGRAGHEAADRFAYEQARVHYDRALAALDRLGSTDERRIGDLLLAKARAQNWSHDFEGGSATLTTAIERARAAGSTRHLAGAALVWGSLDTFGTIDPDWMALVEAALGGLVDEDSPLRVLLLNSLVVARFWTDPPERSLDVSKRALEMAERLDDRVGFVVTACIRHALLLGPEPARERRRLAGDAVRLALASRDPALELSARAVHTGQLIEDGDAAGLDREIAAIERLTGEEHSFSVLTRVSSAQLRGDFAAVEAALGRAMNDPGLELRQLPLAPAFCGLLAALRREQGRLGEIEAALRATLGQAAAVPIWRVLLALALEETGRRDEAQRELDDLAELDFKDLPRTGLWLGTSVLLAELSARLGDRRRAALLYRELLPFEDRVAVIADFLCTGPVERALGLLATTLGRRRQAEGHLARALEQASALGARPLIARIRIESATVALARGAHRRAGCHLSEGAPLARELGMHGLLRTAEALEREIASRS